MLRSSLLTTVLGVLLALPALGDEEPQRRGRPTRPQEPADAPSPADPDASWDLEIFGHGGLAGLASRGEVVGSVDHRSMVRQSAPPEETVGYSRAMHWGVGARVRRGRWGLDLQHHRVGGGIFTPTALVRETPWVRAKELVIPDASVDLLSALAVVEFPFRDQRTTFFVGVGAGYAVMGGNGSDPLPIGDLPPGIGGATVNGEPVTLYVSGSDLRADSGALVLGGSAGVSLRYGRFVVRPRIDGFIGRDRTSAESWDIAFISSRYRGDFNTMTFDTTVRPRFLLFNVDIGWSVWR